MNSWEGLRVLSLLVLVIVVLLLSRGNQWLGRCQQAETEIKSTQKPPNRAASTL